MWEENYGYGEEEQQRNGHERDHRKDAARFSSTIAEASAMKNGGDGVANGSSTTAAATPAAAATTTTSAPISANNGAGTNGNVNGGVCCKGGGNGEGATGSSSSSGGRAPGLRQSVSLAWGCIASDHRVLLLGFVQSLFEGGTFTFGACVVVGIVMSYLS